MASLVAQMVKTLPAMQETWVQSLGWDDPLEKEMETHSSILAWRIPRTEERGRLQSMGWQRVGHDWATSLSLSLSECACVHVCAHSCLTLCDPMDCSPLGSSVQGIFQARILEWVAVSSSRASYHPWGWSHVSCLSCTGRWILYYLSHVGSPDQLSIRDSRDSLLRFDNLLEWLTEFRKGSLLTKLQIFCKRIELRSSGMEECEGQICGKGEWCFPTLSQHLHAFSNPEAPTLSFRGFDGPFIMGMIDG